MSSIPRWFIFFLAHLGVYQVFALNLPPFFKEDLNNLVIPENTPVGTPVSRLVGIDPENSAVRYGIMGTDKLTVDERTGIVTVAKGIDREAEDRLKITVTVEDEDGNDVAVRNVIQIADLNDNSPLFVNKSSYESIEILEDTKVGGRILSIVIEDPDLTGLDLSLNCTPTLQSPEACHVFQLEIREATSGKLKADLKLGQKLDFNKRSLYQLRLTTSDGENTSTAPVLLRIQDVQNTPPVFVGAMSGRVMEDSPVGTLVMVVEARDGDLGNPREVMLSIVNNPGDSFQLDPRSGQLTTTRPLDRETLGSLIELRIKAAEVLKPKEVQSDMDLLQTVANITILIDDVNDFAPLFNEKEFWTEVPENTPSGTPLPDLDILVSDEDSGSFADFTLRIDGPLAELFDIEPKIASGSARPVITVKKAFDYENPNERKFLILVIAENIEEPELTSSCTIAVTTIDQNDNKPSFVQDLFTLSIPESTPAGIKVGEITATDPDSKEYGRDGLVYQLIGAGSKKFSVNPKTGEILVAACAGPESTAHNQTVTAAGCLDYESQKAFDLVFMASDSLKAEGFLHAVAPIQIQLLDDNDNEPYFDSKFARTVLENSNQFEPRFFVKAKDQDSTSLIAYSIKDSSVATQHFEIDPNSAELTIRQGQLPPGNYSFTVSADDGQFAASTPVLIWVLDINNNHPVFSVALERDLKVAEDSPPGSVLMHVQATDEDLDNNGVVRYTIDAGSREDFTIDSETGVITLKRKLDDTITPTYDLVISAYDLGSPSLRTTTLVRLEVQNVYEPLPQILPQIQRVQVSESAEIGDVIVKIATTKIPVQKNLRLNFSIVEVTARNLDNKMTLDTDVINNWFHVNSKGELSVGGALMRDQVISVNLTIALTSATARPGSISIGTLVVTIFDVNLLPPRIEDVEIETYEELPAGMSILTLSCEDPEGGHISNYYIGDGADFVSVDNKTGEIKVAGRMDYEDKQIYNLTVICVDAGLPPLSSTGTVMVSLLNINDNPPLFNQTAYFAEIDEQPTDGTFVTAVSAVDEDGDVIYYEIEPTFYSAAFKIDRLGAITVTKLGSTLLDREVMTEDSLTLGIRAKDSEHHAFVTVHVTVRDVNDNPPKIFPKAYQATVFAPLYFMQELIKVQANGGDQEGTDELRYAIVDGNDQGVFDVEHKTGVVRATRAHEKAGEFRLTVEVTDGQGIGERQSDRAVVKVKVLPGNFRRPEFTFPNRVNSTLPAIESNTAEVRKFTEGVYTKVLGQLLAFDPDEGPAGEVQYYFKDDSHLVTEKGEFRVESETGRILQIKPLDRERMNRYSILVVAKDNGNPVSSEVHDVLNIVVGDIDDNLPKFEDVREYNFSIQENSLENTFIGQVEAKDEDEGRNAQVFYFLVASSKNKHYIHNDFRVDIKSGAIYTNAVLDHERMSQYLFFVRASSSPMKSLEVMTLQAVSAEPALAVVRVFVDDLNDNSPRFPAREYYAGVNSNSEPGRELLVVSSTDVDPTSQPFIQYSLLGSHLILDGMNASGAVLPSPFRIDENNGRLTLSRTAMRRYAGGGNKFLVKVGVKETVAPFYKDETQVRVWVVEDLQEAIVTIKSTPTEMLRQDVIDLLSNITGRLILINKVTPHVNDDGTVNKQWSDVYISAVDKKSNQVLPVQELIQALDLGHDKLQKSGVTFELLSAVPVISAATEVEGHFFFNDRDSFDTAFAGLVALVALLCMGVATILAVCCCLNRMYSTRSLKGSQMSSGMKYPLHPGRSAPGTPTMNSRILKAQPEMIEDMATDNPLWIDHKLKTYEEQELTMQVASDLENSASTEDGISLDGSTGQGSTPQRLHQRQGSPQFSHSYATIHQHPAEYDNIIVDEHGAVHL